MVEMNGKTFKPLTTNAILLQPFFIIIFYENIIYTFVKIFFLSNFRKKQTKKIT